MVTRNTIILSGFFGLVIVAVIVVIVVVPGQITKLPETTVAPTQQALSLVQFTVTYSLTTDTVLSEDEWRQLVKEYVADKLGISEDSIIVEFIPAERRRSVVTRFTVTIISTSDVAPSHVVFASSKNTRDDIIARLRSEGVTGASIIMESISALRPYVPPAVPTTTTLLNHTLQTVSAPAPTPISTTTTTSIDSIIDRCSGSDLVNNGGFDTCNFDGWTTTSLSSDSFIGSYYPYEGNCSFIMRNVDQPGIIEQVVSIAPGLSYNISFWLQVQGSGSNLFQVNINGVVEYSNVNMPATGWQFITLYFTPAASVTSLNISIYETNINSYTYLDSFSVKCVNSPTSTLPNITLRQAVEWCIGQDVSGNCNITTLRYRGAPNAWNTTGITDMSQLFYNLKFFNADISSWDVSSVTTMQGMFKDASAFNRPLNNWTVSSVIAMDGMFYKAAKFNQSLNNWDIGSVTTTAGMFAGATDFNQPLDQWNVGNVSNTEGMFERAENFDQPLNNWTFTRLGLMEGMFFYAEAFNQPLDRWNVAGVTSMSFMFMGAAAFDNDITNWNCSSVNSEMEIYVFFGVWNTKYEIDPTRNADGISGPHGKPSRWRPRHTQVFSGNFSYDYLFTDVFKDDDYESGLHYGEDHISMDCYVNSQLSNELRLSVKVCLIESPSGNCNLTNGTFRGEISGWNTTGVTCMKHLFHNKKGFNADISLWDLSSVTDTSMMFFHAFAFNQDIGNWSVGSVTNMSGMFGAASSFNQDIGRWTVTAVTNMAAMFALAIAFNHDIGGWKVDAVTNMAGMFMEARDFDQDIRDWHVSKVTDMAFMFSFAIAFNQNISGWDVSSVKYFDHMFAYAVFAYDVTGWNCSSSISEDDVFRNNYVWIASFEIDPETADGIISPHGNPSRWKYFPPPNATLAEAVALCIHQQPNGNCYIRTRDFNGPPNSWNTTGIISMANLFSGRTEFNADISSWDVSSVTDMTSMFRDASSFNQDISSWRVHNVQSMENMFFHASQFNCDIGNWSVANVVNMNGMFAYTSDFNQDISRWVVSNVTSMTAMFDSSRQFNQPLDRWRVNKVTSMYFMFSESIFDHDITMWNCTGITDNQEQGVFTGANAWNSKFRIKRFGNREFLYGSGKPSRWELRPIVITTQTVLSEDNALLVAAVAECIGQNIAGNCNLNSERFTGSPNQWNTTGVTSMDYLFYNHQSFNSDISSWDVRSVTNMSGMFRYASSFNQNLSKWKVGAVTDMTQMFDFTTKFNFDLNDWDVRSVRSMRLMFAYARRFNKPLDKWNVNAVTDMDGMFSQGSGFNQNISMWDTREVTNFNSMFSGASAFDFDITSWLCQDYVSEVSVFTGATAWNAKFNLTDAAVAAGITGTDGKPSWWQRIN